MSELKRIIIDFLIVFMLRYEGLLLSVGGNGRSYVLILEAGPPADTSQSRMYFSRFSTKVGFCRVNNLFPVCKEPKKRTNGSVWCNQSMSISHPYIHSTGADLTTFSYLFG